MSEICQISDVHGDKIIIQQKSMQKTMNEDSCFGCMKTECRLHKGFIVTENPDNISLKKGESVEIQTNLVVVLIQAVVALGLPVLGFIAGFFLTSLIFPDSKDPARAAAGVLLMFVAAFGLYQLRRYFPAKTPYQIIQRKPSTCSF